MPRKPTKKIYISVPSEGKTKAEVEAGLDWMRKQIDGSMGSHWVEVPASYPWDFNDYKNGAVSCQFQALGQSWKLMGGATHIFFHPDWTSDWRCTMEYDLAARFKLNIFLTQALS